MRRQPILGLCVLALLCAVGLAQNLEQETCDASRSVVDVNMNGANVILGGLFEIRTPSSGGYACGEPHKELMQVYEAAKWTIQKINDVSYLPGLRMGMRAFDTCGDPSLAIKAAVDFFPQFSSLTNYCNESETLKLGALGPLSSWTSKPVAALTSSYPATTLSPRAASPALSDKSKYPYFLRTSSSAAVQAKVMLNIASEFRWERVLLVYSDTDYGLDGYDTLIRQATARGICIAEAVSVPSLGDTDAFKDRLLSISNIDITGGIFFGSYINALTFFDALDTLQNIGGIQWIMSDLNLEETYSSRFARGVLYVAPKTTYVDEFARYFTSLSVDPIPSDNPWFQDWYMTVNECRLSSVSYEPYTNLPVCTVKSDNQRLADYIQLPYVDTTIKAVYAYASALKAAQQNSCGGFGLCQSLQQMTTVEFHRYLKDVDFQFGTAEGIPSLNGERVAFDDNGDSIDHDYTIWSYSNIQTGTYQFQEIGSHDSGVLTMDTAQIRMYDSSRQTPLSNIPSSSCPAGGCLYCTIPRDMVAFDYFPGDLLIGGVFNVHGSSMEALSCGELIARNAQQSVAFLYALQNVKSMFSNILPGVNLGGFVADICDSGLTARLFVNNILGHRHIVKDKKGRAIDPYSITAFIEGITSTNTRVLSPLLSNFWIPELGITASSVELSDRDMFPLYSRAIPADDKQSEAIALFLSSESMNYVQLVHSADSYGRNGAKMFRKKASEKGICVTSLIELWSDGGYNDVISQLNKKSNAGVVVLIVNDMDYRSLLMAVRDQGLVGSFMFVAYETWGRSNYIVSGLEDVASGSVTIEIEDNTMPGYLQWLGSIDPNEFNEISWFKEWYQDAYSCYLDASYTGKYDRRCSGGSINNAPGYEERYHLSYVVNGVYAIARALDATLRNHCGNNYNGVCSNFRSSVGVSKDFVSYLSNSSFYGETNNQFRMDNGVGTANYKILNYRQVGGYVEIGEYDTLQGQYRPSGAVGLVLPTGASKIISLCEGQCLECAYMHQTDLFLTTPGDVTIGGLFGMHYAGNDGPLSCGNIKTVNGFQYALAMLYAVQQVNEKIAPVSLNGIKLGGFAADYCENPTRARTFMNNFYAGVITSDLGMNAIPDPKHVLAWMTDNTASTMEIKDIVNQLNLPIISPSATSVILKDTDLYPTFYSTVQGDTSVTIALAKLAKSLDIPYLTVIHSATEYGRNGMSLFSTIASQERVCVVNSYEMGTDGGASEILRNAVATKSHAIVLYTGISDTEEILNARAASPLADRLLLISPQAYNSIGSDKMLSLALNSPELTGYKAFIQMLSMFDFREHPVLAAYYQEMFQCDLAGQYKYQNPCANNPRQPLTDAPTYVQDSYVLSTINAVYSFVSALDAILEERCGDDYEGFCGNFSDSNDLTSLLLQQIDDVQFQDPSGASFRFINREGNTGYSILQSKNGAYKKVGEYAGASIHLSDESLLEEYDMIVSECEEPCLTCIKQTLEYSFIPGDVLIGGIFDVHKGDVNPFSCADINTLHGFQLLEAFHYAIENVNDKSGPFRNILRNVKLGGFGLDSCESAIRTGYLVSNVHNGLLELSRNGVVINPDDINAYIGSYSSDRSLYLARLLKALKIPQISYASTSTELSDKDRFPYFLRTVPSDDKQALAMVEFLKANNIRYVQIVHTPNSYGRLGAEMFEKHALENKICVAQTVVFPDSGSVTRESANDVVTAILKKPMANTIAMFADTSYINALLTAVKGTPDATDKFHFIGSEAWATNLDAIAGVEDLSEGSVTLNIESSDLQEFDLYMGSLTPANTGSNPWFPEYYEDMNDCYLTIQYLRYQGRQCPPQPMNVVESKRYQQDPGILHVINSVYAAAIGIDGALRSVCGQGYTTVCESFKNRQDRRDYVLHHTMNATFVDPSGKDFFFENREGNKGYSFYSIQPPSIYGFAYKPVGFYSFGGELTFKSEDYTPGWDGSCERQDACSECPTVRNRLQRYMLQDRKQQYPATVVGFFGLHDRGNDDYRCGMLNVNEFVKSLAFLYMLNEYFGNSVPFGLRALILDTCSNPLRIDQDIYSLLSAGRLCNSLYGWEDGQLGNDSIVGFMTMSSRDTVAANRVLGPLGISLVSPAATSTILSDQRRFPTFARTVPPDDLQMKVIARILKRFDWEYVSVVYTPEMYGVTALEELKNATEELGSCVGLAIPLTADATEVEANSVLDSLVNQDGANVIVIISQNPRPILLAAKAKNILGKFFWIATDTWGTSRDIIDGLGSELVGRVITIEIRNSLVNDFVNYLKDLRYDKTNPNLNNKNIPSDWFEEFFQIVHKCSLIDATVVMTMYSSCVQPYKDYEIVDDMIDGNMSLHIIAATYALTKSVDLFKGQCGSSTSISDCFNIVDNPRQKLFESLLAQKWAMDENLEIDYGTYNLAFNDKRFWNVGFNTYGIVRKDGQYIYEWSGVVMGDDFNFTSTDGEGIVSRCPADKECECERVTTGPTTSGQTRGKMIKNEPRNYYLYEEKTDDEGRKYWDPNSQKYTWPIWAIVVAIVTCVGILAGIMLFFYFLVAYPFRGGSTVLGFLSLIGILGIYGVNFAFFLPATDIVCGARRMVLGIVYAIVFAALLVKAIDNWRFSDYDYGNHPHKGLTGALSLFFVALGIICVQVIIPVEWLVLVHPTASQLSDSKFHDWWICDPPDFYDKALVLSMIFVMFLVLLTAIFSALSWDSDSNYYESRWILYGSIATAGCFLVWMVVITNAGHPYRDPAVAIGNFFNATVLLLCIHVRKMGLLIYLQHSERKEEKEEVDMQDIAGANDIYSTVYTNQVYEPDVYQRSSKHSSSDQGYTESIVRYE